MQFEFENRTVPLASVRTEIEFYRITTNTACDDLIPSIGRAGLVTPPILKHQDEGLVIVCGFRRVAAIRALGWEMLPARFLPEETEPLTCALLAIAENTAERPLNPIETSRALLLLSAFLPDPKALSSIAKDLGLPHGPGLLNRIIPLCRLPESVQAGILSGDISLPAIQMLEKLKPEDRLALSGLLQQLKLNLNKQRELITILQEIAIIEEQTISEIIHAPEFQKILDDTDMDTPRKASLVRSLLKKRRFPNITRAEEAFDRLKNSLDLGEKGSLTPPAGFEGNRYTLTLSFSSRNDLLDHGRTIERLAHDETVKTLLESR